MQSIEIITDTERGQLIYRKQNIGFSHAKDPGKGLIILRIKTRLSLIRKLAL